jgi:Pterin-4a-carbinolamine dehydratase
MSADSQQDPGFSFCQVNGWKIDSGKLIKTFNFKDFLAGIDFVNQIAKAAEGLGHHPDIDIRYNKVSIAVTTHDAGGLTNKDFELAAEIEKVA